MCYKQIKKEQVRLLPSTSGMLRIKDNNIFYQFLSDAPFFD